MKKEEFDKELMILLEKFYSRKIMGKIKEIQIEVISLEGVKIEARI